MREVTVVPVGKKAPADGRYFLWLVPFTRREWQRFLAAHRTLLDGFKLSHPEQAAHSAMLKTLDKAGLDTALPVNVLFQDEAGPSVTLATMPRRRSSRRRTSRRNPASAPSSRRVTIKRGSISGSGFKATAYKGRDAAFRGRIAVERGSGMIEFPSLAQLPRILREEGISPKAAEQAFGRGRGMKANGGAVVRHGYLKVGDTEASEYVGSEKRLAGKIHVTGPGIDTYKSPVEFARLAEKLGVDTDSVFQAFRHLIQSAKLSEATDAGALTYGLKRMKLGHIGPRGIALGTKAGSLVLFDSRSGSPVWGAIEEPPKTIRNISTNRVLSLDSVFAKAKALKIPPQAVYDAFGHLMTTADKKALLATFHGMKIAKNRRHRHW